MEKIRVLVAEDADSLTIDIEKILMSLNYEIVNIVYTGDKIIKEIEKRTPDIIILNMNLKGKIDGIETALIIKENYNIPVIFLTEKDDDETIKRALQAEPSSYLLKPVNPKELDANIKISINQFRSLKELKQEKMVFSRLIGNPSQNNIIFVRAKHRIHKVDLNEIYYIEALQDYIVIKTKDNSFTVHCTMKDFMKDLPENDFIRIHRGYIIRLDKIQSIKYPELVLEDGMKELQIGGLYRKDLFEKLNIV